MAWKVKKGHRYVIEVYLNWVESFAPDCIIVSKFTESGFTDVKTSTEDNGAIRIIEATWNKKDTEIPEEAHLRSILEKK